MLTEFVSGLPSQMLRVRLGTKMTKVKSVPCFPAFANILYLVSFHLLPYLLW